MSASNGQDEADEGEERDTEDLDEGDEDQSDLGLAWKVLDLARPIAEKDPCDTMEKVDILSTLAKVALERGISTEELRNFLQLPTLHS